MTDENQAAQPSLADTVFSAFGQETPEEYRAKPVEPSEPVEQRNDGRDDLGRFAKKEEASEQPQEPEKTEPAVEATDGGDKAEPVADEPAAPEGDGGVSNRPPNGWSVSSKAAWDELPASVKADIAKREAEVNDGFKQYSGLKDVIPYQQQYAQQGASVKQALDAYTAVDRMLAQDFTTGLAYICQSRKIEPVHAAMAILQKAGVDVSRLGTQGEGQPQQPQVFRDPRVDDLQRRLDEEQAAREQELRQGVQEQLQKFANDPKNTYYDNVKVTMGHLIQTGQASDLQDAYDKACWLNPEIRELRIKQEKAAELAKLQPQRQAAAATQARQSARSITGSPTMGASSGGPKPKLSDREAIAEAMRSQGIAV